MLERLIRELERAGYGRSMRVEHIVIRYFRAAANSGWRFQRDVSHMTIIEYGTFSTADEGLSAVLKLEQKEGWEWAGSMALETGLRADNSMPIERSVIVLKRYVPVEK